MIEKKTTVAGSPANDFIRIQDLWGMFLPKWRWFALSLLVTLLIATFYLLSTPPVYTRTASILIKDDSKSGSSTASADLSNAFADMGIFKSNTNINNELLTIQSPTLMTEVVNRLYLNEIYTVRHGLRTVELYKDSPVAVVMPRSVEDAVGFDIKLTSAHEFTLTNFRVADASTDKSYSGKMGDTIRTSVGPLVLTTTKWMNDDYLGKSIHFDYADIEAVTDYYGKELHAELGSDDATIITLSISDPSIQKAEDILNSLIAVYNENWIQDKNQIAISTSQFIDGRLGVIANELGVVDEDISSYKSKHLLPDVQAASSLYMTQAAENRKDLLTLNTQLATVRYLRNELNKKPLDQLLPANSGIDNTGLETQISDYNTLVLNRNRLIANSSVKNPLVIDMATSLRDMQKTILQSMDNLIVALNTQISSMQRQEVTTTDQLASSPDQAKYLMTVERQQKVKEALYLYLLQKREENELSQAFTAYNTRIITAPRGSALPTAPRKMNILLVAFAIGLLVPAVSIFLMENMNTKVRGRKDLENMSTPFLGEIPMSGDSLRVGKKKRTEEVVVQAESQNLINDSFRVVRTNLEFMNGKEHPYKMIMMTSINPGSGKTFISLNLSTTFALKNKRVVLVDLDMRRAALSHDLHSHKVGIANYLAGRVPDWHSTVIPGGTLNPSLLPDVIPVGTLPPNPSELLFSPLLEQLFVALRAEYDYIFIDCPPVEMVADTSIIARWTDLTLFVVRAEVLEREMLPVVDSYYTEHKFNNMALLLNGTAKYGGRHGYHYGYGYHKS